MELWVRSQNKLCLKKVNELFITGGEDYYYIEDQDTGTLGKYVSEGRALEILDEIHNSIIMNKIVELTITKVPTKELNSKEAKDLFKQIIYEMPEE